MHKVMRLNSQENIFAVLCDIDEMIIESLKCEAAIEGILCYYFDKDVHKDVRGKIASPKNAKHNYIRNIGYHNIAQLKKSLNARKEEFERLVWFCSFLCFFVFYFVYSLFSRLLTCFS